MALPTLTNVLINGTATGGAPRGDLLPNGFSFSDGTVTTNTLPQNTALVVAAPTIGVANKTVNLTSDTMLYRADGGIWDDTQQCWISVDLGNLSPTPRKYF